MRKEGGPNGVLSLWICHHIIFVCECAFLLCDLISSLFARPHTNSRQLARTSYTRQAYASQSLRELATDLNCKQRAPMSLSQSLTNVTMGAAKETRGEPRLHTEIRVSHKHQLNWNLNS